MSFHDNEKSYYHDNGMSFHHDNGMSYHHDNIMSYHCDKRLSWQLLSKLTLAFLTEKFKNESVVSHNYYRSLHGAQPIQWSTRLAIEAQNFAEKLVRSGSFMHSGEKEVGECLAFSFGLELSGRDAVDSWYDEIVDYDYEFPGFTSHTANFTQLVWQETREFGTAKAIGEDGSCVVVGRYYPPGNQVGGFQENVTRKQPGYF